MAIPEDKARLIITIPNKLKSEFECICELDKRTASKEIEYILEYYKFNVETRLTDEDYYKYYEETYKPRQLADKVLPFFINKTGFYKNRPVNVENFYDSFKYDHLNSNVFKLIDISLDKYPEKKDLFKACVDYYNSQTLNKKD